ncbi:RNA polymerase sigma24 factor [Actinorhabdospora filicis]|uniref:RNA polymerase sigma24 factor n=1 Tax=Actinorhabdospora filicis TaxID=1785913 RepID=A0A9W6SUL4_9ACTN|nr:SigE family RNA polymerase sigma factor [Actinorhabdospora filicis]GLZ81041.1 RNA polymerase sigma24 factor [Actinorhabdospora filicis]
MRSDQEAEFRQYVTARADRLRRFAYLCCGDWHRAEDAVQTAFIKLYGAWHRKNSVNFDRYVRRTITNVLIDEGRLAWFRRVRSVGEPPEPPPADGADRKVDRLTIMDALARLPKRQRAVVVLRYWEDHSIEQVAEVLRCSTGTVKSQGARGLRTLRALLADSMPGRGIPVPDAFTEQTIGATS